MADISWITERLAIGGGIWRRENLDAVARAGVTHIINTQVEFDDRSLLRAGENHLAILHLPMDDNFQPKSAALLHQGVTFALHALAQPTAKLLVHCASGVHRGPMVALAILRVLGFTRHDALRLIESHRPQADFLPPYLDSVEDFLAEWLAEQDSQSASR